MLSELSIQLSIFLQTLGDGFLSTMDFFSFFGTEEFYLLIMPLFVWVIDYAIGMRLGIMLTLTAPINSMFKFMFHSPRPYWVNSAVKTQAFENSFGIPSGHSQTPASIFGLTAAQYKRRGLTLLLVVFVFLIGVSRLALGVHFIQDVLAGWALGLFLLWAFLKLETPLLGWFNKQTNAMQYVYALLSGVVLALLGFLTLAIFGGFEIPAEWTKNALLTAGEGDEFNPFSPSSFLTPTGTMSGFLLGYLWLKQRGGFSTEGKWWQYVLRYAVGLVGVLVLWLGLGAVLPRSADLIGYLSRFGRYLLIGFWVSGLAPWLFKKLKLAE